MTNEISIQEAIEKLEGLDFKVVPKADWEQTQIKPKFKLPIPDWKSIILISPIQWALRTINFLAVVSSLFIGFTMIWYLCGQNCTLLMSRLSVAAIFLAVYLFIRGLLWRFLAPSSSPGW